MGIKGSPKLQAVVADEEGFPGFQGFRMGRCLAEAGMKGRQGLRVDVDAYHLFGYRRIYVFEAVPCGASGDRN